MHGTVCSFTRQHTSHIRCAIVTAFKVAPRDFGDRHRLSALPDPCDARRHPIGRVSAHMGGRGRHVKLRCRHRRAAERYIVVTRSARLRRDLCPVCTAPVTRLHPSVILRDFYGTTEKLWCVPSYACRTANLRSSPFTRLFLGERDCAFVDCIDVSV